MKNQNTGKFECSKYFHSSGVTILGTGDTQEEARVDYKAKLAKYREQPLVPTGEYLSSPGFGGIRLDDGRVRYQFMRERTIQVLARPELAEALKKQDESK